MRVLTLVLFCLFLAMPCTAEVITVDDNGGVADFNNIQDTINYSWHGDTIIVYPGTYNKSVNFNGRAITLTSTDPNDLNVVNGTVITVDSGYAVKFEWGEGNNSLLVGFKIYRGGIYCNSSSPTITKNVICDYAYSGAGITGGNPIILENTISGCAFGIMSCNGSIKNNIISDNKYGIVAADGLISYNVIKNNIATNPDGYGLGSCHGTISYNTIINNTVGLSNCSGTIANNTISNNTRTNSSGSLPGGGLYECSGEIINNIITNNYSRNGGGGLGRCHGNIKGNIIVGNISNNGGGGGLYGCDANISNNIIAGNRNEYGGLGGGIASCSNSIYNNTIVGNVAEQGGAMASCAGAVYNNIMAFNKSTLNSVGGILGEYNGAYNAFWMNQGGDFGGGATPRLGDICVDPLFTINGHWDGEIWTDGDYHLKSEAGRYNPSTETWVIDSATSHCIDAGDPCNSINYEPNPNGGRINMGVYGGSWEASKSTGGNGNEPLPRCLEYPAMDFNKDCKVNFEDFALFAQSWLDCNLDPPSACWK